MESNLKAGRTNKPRTQVLIVEDSVTQAENLRYLLESEAYQVDVARNGKEALQLLQCRKPALIISDVVMPEMDGYALCKTIKDDDKLKTIPFVLVTSLSSPKDLIRGLQSGADGFIRKPYDEQHLMNRVDYMLKNKSLHPRSDAEAFEIELAGETHSITTSTEKRQIIDLLVSTYEEAIRVNDELQATQREITRSYQWVDGLYHLVQALNRSTTVQEVIRRSVEKVMQLPGIQYAWIVLNDGLSYFPTDAGTPRGGEADMHITLWTGDRDEGLLNLMIAQGALSPENRRILEGVGNQIGIALERSRLYTGFETAVAERTATLQRELTERRRAEERVREQAELLDKARDAIIVCDLSRRITYWNKGAERLTGWSTEEVIGKDIDDRLFRDRAVIEAARKITLEKDEWIGEVNQLRKDGSEILVEVRYTLVRDSKGTPKAWLAIVNDITQRRQLEDQLRQSQRLEAIGQLAGGVAHDFNNLLTVILGRSDLLKMKVHHEGPMVHDLDLIHQTAMRAAALTRQLLAFSRRQILQPRVLSLNEIIADMDKMLRRLIGENIELSVALDPDLGSIKADLSQIEQIVLNLVVNARDAMPDGGKLVIESTNVVLDETYANRHVGSKPGSYAMLAVSDTGCGMKPEVQTRIFEPFFTTKENGTGLGLSTVYGIVKQSGGNIWVYSELQRGTTFKVYLPRIASPADAPLARSKSKEETCGTETILLVEDEAEVRDLAEEILAAAGYTVIKTAGILDAIRFSQMHSGPIDLLVSDVVMPEMNGSDFAARLKQTRPELKVLFMSGYTDKAIIRHGVLNPGVNFIQKPFAADALLRKVREVLETNAIPSGI